MIADTIRYRTSWVLTKYVGDHEFKLGRPFAVEVIDMNMLLNVGIGQVLLLLTGQGGTPFGSAQARLGVGDSSAAEVAGQAGLQATTNKAYRPMEAGFPLIFDQTVSFRSVFSAADANFNWREFSIDNGATALNRRVSNQGRKYLGQTWTLDLQITLS